MMIIKGSISFTTTRLYYIFHLFMKLHILFLIKILLIKIKYNGHLLIYFNELQVQWVLYVLKSVTKETLLTNIECRNYILT